MATLARILRTCKVLPPGVLRRSISATSVLQNWNKDWKPGPYPTTSEERAAAAKKYGMRVEDYDVYPDDGMGYGDYPKLPYVSGDVRDPYEDWDIPELKRNFGEPLHVDYDAIGEDRWNASANPRVPYWRMILTTFSVLGGIALVFYITLPYPHFLPAMQKQYPFNNLYLENGGDPDKEPTIKHYTFEPAQ
ncbi:NADH dehydrogenase [ubiquinone] 1 beta subcomplex subunit 8, mitochondrial-like [Gigantopelta aegis]|uniref:NADH dehydrogenase [ubiquinone] 1 beta subcomplex subunit 8, mitochondrial-like n=1 Tax=Gigantopelta aegis TaxID=1735272 RepID=UPI001B88DE8A|nr:NADH dehydrogenase [ubiquinone] 1 beta subcomplex subunit 8, mitochondrial-like [Gigantopelta aegis]